MVPFHSVEYHNRGFPISSGPNLKNNAYPHTHTHKLLNYFFFLRGGNPFRGDDFQGKKK